jgi:hypothetical protein
MIITIQLQSPEELAWLQPLLQQLQEAKAEVKVEPPPQASATSLPSDASWQDFFAGWGEFSEDFMAERGQPPHQARDWFE